MTGQLQVGVFTLDAGIVVVRVGGALDMDSYPTLQMRLAEALTFHRPPLVAVDVGGVTAADSYGLSVLIAAEQHARTLGGRMAVCAPGDLLRATFQRRGLDQVLNPRPTLAEAVRDLRAVPRQPPA
ncbi:MAG: STAS domain-containing protein [Nonomuraea sp.]|nr:STAS domain-containing protein [Nonomuraea sp.]NUR85659.1 STAS domain-containing protein [Nonomuraea sp.]